MDTGKVIIDLDSYDIEAALKAREPSDESNARVLDIPDAHAPNSNLRQQSTRTLPPPPELSPEDGTASKIAAASQGTGNHSIFSNGRNVHDATIVFISLRPLTAAIKRFVWQSVYVVIAGFYLWAAFRSLMRLGLLLPSVWAGHDLGTCNEVEIAVCFLMGQMGISLLVAVALARSHKPSLAIKLIGCAAFLGALLAICAAVIDGIVCKEALRGLLSYGMMVPQALALSYVFLFDECKWHRVLFIVSCTNLVIGAMLSWLFDTLYYNVLGIGAVGVLYTVGSFAWRRYLLFRALRALRPFKDQFDEVWQPMKQNQQAELVELAKVAHGHQQSKHLQPCCGFNSLMQAATDINPWYQDVVANWAQELQVTQELQVLHKAAPLKKQARVLEKIERSYKGDMQRVLDLVRASIICETVEAARKALELVLREARVFVVKCRYDLDFDSVSTNGYRDINMQLSFDELQGTRFEGFVFELQIILVDFFKIKCEGQHEKYIECRNLRGD